MSETLTTSLNLSQVMAIAEITQMTRAGSKFAWVRPDREEPLYGHVRSLRADAEGHTSVNPSTDVRDIFVRITHRSGTEGFYAIAELAQAVLDGQFFSYDWS